MRKNEFLKSYFKKLFENFDLTNNSILVVTLTKNEELETLIKKYADEYKISELKFIYNNYEEKEKALLEKNEEEIGRLFNNNLYNIYALKGAFFLYLLDSFKYCDEIDTEYLIQIQRKSLNTMLFYAQLKLFNKIKWGSAFIPDDTWVSLMCEENQITEDELFKKLYESCGLDGSFELYKEKIKKNSSLLNSYNFDSIRFVNSLGTDITFGIKDRKWVSIFDYEMNGERFVPNFPSYEIYTTPYRSKVNGTIYSSKKIIYEEKELDGIILNIVDGKIVSCTAEVGEEHLKTIINIDSGSDMIGEIAIVESDSPIYKSGLFYHNTLLDENASCHIAVGMGMLITKDSINNKEDIIREEVNMSSVHMDMMIGTVDMRIFGYKDGKEYLIYENGKIVLM